MPHKVLLSKPSLKPDKFKTGDLVVAKPGRLDQNHVYLLTCGRGTDYWQYIGYSVNGGHIAVSSGTFSTEHYELFQGELLLTN